MLNPMTQNTGFASVPSSQLLQMLKMIESLTFFCHAWCWISYCLCHSNFMSDQIPFALSSLTLSLHELHIQCCGWFDRCLTVSPFGSSGCVCTHRSALMKLWPYRVVPAASYFLRSLKRIRYPAQDKFQLVLFLLPLLKIIGLSTFKCLNHQHKYRNNTHQLCTRFYKYPEQNF